jgi:hypothetical protein
MAPQRPVPPPDMVAAEQDYHHARGILTDIIDSVRVELAEGFTDFQAAVDIFMTLRAAKDPTVALFVGAIATVQIAKMPQPPPRLAASGESDTKST